LGERRGVCRDLWGNLRETDHLKDPGVDGIIIIIIIIIIRIIRKWNGGMDWNYLAQDRDRWRVMNLRVP
jgi:hypothetical protein